MNNNATYAPRLDNGLTCLIYLTPLLLFKLDNVLKLEGGNGDEAYYVVPNEAHVRGRYLLFYQVWGDCHFVSFHRIGACWYVSCMISKWFWLFCAYLIRVHARCIPTKTNNACHYHIYYC